MEIPIITTELRKHIVEVPGVIKKYSTGITITGKTINSLVFTTDIAIIKNTNADAVIAVYPFTPNPAITQAIMSVADIPVLCGVGGGLTSGKRSANVALHAEFQGALAVVLNGPVDNETIKYIKETVDIPIVITVISENTNIDERLQAGASILNVSGGDNTPYIVDKIRKVNKNVPIIATGGPTEESIMRTINAGANSITYTPPTSGDIFKKKMKYYRDNAK